MIAAAPTIANSYMFPHGARSAASPRATTAITFSRKPMTTSTEAMRVVNRYPCEGSAGRSFTPVPDPPEDGEPTRVADDVTDFPRFPAL
ncbi:hypothetical protein AFL01nite_05880 [Aeromicrobium flavum]|uniref:Uncharacterized protein n=1 Tax=Aeromicrobium flavum TaxID=416568 RepID=A0A512HS21_9ACTN|nr:hypothetical protein AFL01nite_05880 [Aeromicrobium flavum]